MKKRVTMIMLALVLICLIFFTFLGYPGEPEYEGVLVRSEYGDGGWTG